MTFDRYTTDRDALLDATAEERGLHPVRAYDDPAIVAGQGTAALELIEEVGGLDVLVAPLGGGGLISGCSLVAKSLDARCAVVGVEPEERRAARAALEAGGPVDVPIPRTIADGQQTASIGQLNHRLIERNVDAVVGVPDAEIVAAMKLLFE